MSKHTPPAAKAGKGQKICPWCNIPTSSRRDNCRHCERPIRSRASTLLMLGKQLEQLKALGGVVKVRERIAKIRRELKELDALNGIDQAEQLCEVAERLRSTLE